MGSKRVVVTGMGAITPIGNNLNDYKNSLYKGSSGCDNIISFDTAKFKTKFACEIKGYDPLDYFDRKEVRKYDPFSQYALVSTDQAVKDAAINFDEVDKTRVGVIWGSGNGGILLTDDKFSDFELRLDIKPDWGVCSGLFLRGNDKGQCFQMMVS